MVRVLLTGATGFVGGRLAARLRSEGHQVVAPVRAPSASLAALEVTQVDGGLDAVTPALAADSQVVIHAAATVGPDLATARSVNVDGTSRVAEAVRAAGVPRLVHVSTTAVYVPASTGAEELDEAGPTVGTDDQAASPYAVTKAGAERVLLDADLEGTHVAILRPPAVLGAGPTSTWGRRVPQRILDGQAIEAPRDSTFGFVHVEDLVDAVLAATGLIRTRTRWPVDGAGSTLVVNVVGGHVPLGTYLDAVVALLPARPPQVPGREAAGWQGRYRTDRLSQRLGVRPWRPFQDAMAEIASDWAQPG